MPWCPYTDKELLDDETSREHILPLALGGIDGFELPVCKKFNSTAGSSIDGAVANDFLVIGRRNALDIRGHSNKRPVFVVKRGEDVATGSALQVEFDQKAGIKTWSPRAREYVPSAQVKINFRVNLDCDFRFVAKVGLAAGYFAYGDLFRRFVRHDELRTIMNEGSATDEATAASIETRADGRFSDSPDETIQILRAMCRAVPAHSLVGLMPGPANFGIFVGILGQYFGMLNVPALTTQFPNSGNFQWGHVMCPQDGKLVRTSFRRAAEQFGKFLDRSN